MRGEKIFKILAAIEYGVRNFLDLMEVIPTTYPQTFFNIQKELRKRKGRTLFFEDLEIYLKEKEKLQKLLFKLKKEGFIYQNKQTKNFYLTEKGLQKLKVLKLIFVPKEEELKKEVNKVDNNDLIIIIYDIPEYERKKRNLLRRILTSNNFQFLQKSVWIKKGKIKEKLIEILKELDLLDYLHIFKVNQKGTIEKF